MKVKLNVLERVLLMNMLPQRGNFATCRAASNTGKIITITPEEEKEYNIRKDGAITQWDDKGKEGKEFELPPSSVKMIRDQLKKLDAAEQLPFNAVTLWEKFIEPIPDEDMEPA